MKNVFLKSLLLLLVSCFSYSQVEKEVVPPFNIKSVAFIQNGQNTIPLFGLNESFQIQFDDLYGNEANYYYEIVHCNYDWKPSELSKNEYISGFDNIRIQDYSNSFNTLQIYSHYKLSLPNKNTQFNVSGNYMLHILNEERDIVFSRKFMLTENFATVPISIKRARTMETIDTKQNLDFSVKSASIMFQSPLQNVKVALMQNGQINSMITNIKPMYTIGNDLIYKYDAETQFWAGNEFLFFENKDAKARTNNVGSVDLSGGLYNTHLYTNFARGKSPYTFYPDANGTFIPNCINAENSEIESDYTWVFFSLNAPFYENKDIYINGMFNNYALSSENKMDYNQSKGLYEKAIIIKQGFTNYQYILADKSGTIDYKNNVDGNYFQTENNYFVIVYYRENGKRYDRIIGKGVANSTDITN
jgi:hypothetical protein